MAGGWTEKDVEDEISLLSSIRAELHRAKQSFDVHEIERLREKYAKQLTEVRQGQLAIASAEDKEARAM
eukprot:3932380-Rhodomonas_salina.1